MPSYSYQVASENTANMCLQFVCHMCGRDLEGDKSLVPCLDPMLTLRLIFGVHEICPDYVRMEAGAPYRCNTCLEIDPSAVGASLTPTSPEAVFNK